MKNTIVDLHWVAAAYNDPTASAWAITVQHTAETMDEATAQGAVDRLEVCNIARATELGLDLASCVADINNAAHAANDQLTMQLNDLDTQLTAAQTQCATATTALEQMTAQRDQLQQQIDSLQAQLAQQIATTNAALQQAQLLQQKLDTTTMEPAA